MDEPELRRDAGVEGNPSVDDIEATRRAMLDKVLETRRFPFALIHVTRVDAQALAVTLTLHGVTRSQQIPAQIRTLADGVEVSGKLAIQQTDFGITPLAVMGGGLRVEDALTLRFRVRARP
jgi:polyisoprenoid-binding protein YceI